MTLFLLALSALSASPLAAPDEAAFERFRDGTFDLQTLSEVLPSLADPDAGAG